MALTRWNPFRDMDEVEREFLPLWRSSSRLFPWTRRTEEDELGAVDVYETANEFVVEASLPGVKPEDTHLSVGDHTLTIEGESKYERDDSQERIHRRERKYGSFA